MVKCKFCGKETGCNNPRVICADCRQSKKYAYTDCCGYVPKDEIWYDQELELSDVQIDEHGTTGEVVAELILCKKCIIESVMKHASLDDLQAMLKGKFPAFSGYIGKAKQPTK